MDTPTEDLVFQAKCFCYKIIPFCEKSHEYTVNNVQWNVKSHVKRLK